MSAELTVGLVGAGMIAGVHAHAYRACPGVRVVGVADPVPGKAGRLAEQYGAMAVPDLDALLALGVDVVDVCTPPTAHADAVVAALRAGRPPLPPSYPSWITDPVAAGGGALIDHSVHVTDAMRHVSGLEVVEVAAEAGALLWDCGVDDVALVSLRFDTGAVGSIDPSWSVPADHPADYDFFLRLLGTEGSLDLTDGAESVRVTRAGGVRDVGFGEDPDRAMVDAFLASVRAGRVLEPCATGEDGLRSLEVALGGYRSSAAGQAVEVR